MFNFASLDELKAFLAFAGYVKSPAMKTVREGEIEITAPAHDPIWNDPVTVDPAEGNLDVAIAGEQPAAVDTGTHTDTPAPAEQKRKRRTKAEIEAEKAAEVARLAAHNQANATADANLAEHGAEAVAAYAKPETTPAGTTSFGARVSAAGGNPFAQQSLPAEGKDPEGTVVEQPKATAPADATPEQAKQFEINEFVAARLAERPTLEQREHLLLARTFIGKHGMPKYNESFQLVGLSPNVMPYTEADCARHAAALDFLGLE